MDAWEINEASNELRRALNRYEEDFTEAAAYQVKKSFKKYAKLLQQAAEEE